MQCNMMVKICTKALNLKCIQETRTCSTSTRAHNVSSRCVKAARIGKCQAARTPMPRSSLSSTELLDPAEMSQAHPATLEHTAGFVFALQAPLMHRLLLHVQPLAALTGD